MTLEKEGSLVAQVASKQADLGIEFGNLLSCLGRFEERLIALGRLGGVGLVYQDFGSVRPFVNVIIAFKKPFDLLTEDEDQIRVMDEVSDAHAEFSLGISELESPSVNFDSMLDIAVEWSSKYESFKAVLEKEFQQEANRTGRQRREILLGIREFS